MSKLRKSILAAMLVFSFSADTFAAEESLNSLQRDVVLAKEKSAAITGKMNSVTTALDDAKAHIVERQSEELVEAIDQSGSASDTAPPEPEPVPATVQKTPRKVYKPTFRDQIEAAPAHRVPTAVPAVDEENPIGKLDLVPDRGQTLAQSIEKKWLRWPNLNFLFPKTNRQAQNKPLPYAPPQKITDGQALYKVAVSDDKITVGEAVEIGLLNNAQMKALKKNVEVADAKLMEAKRGLFPVVQGVTEVGGGKIPGFAGQRHYRSRNTTVNVTQPLYYGGELQNTVRQAEENVLVAKSEYKKARNDFIHQVRLSYYAVVKAEYNAQYQIELFERLSALLKILRDEHDLKLMSEIDYLNVESQYYQVLYQVEASKNDVLSANVGLRQSMSLDFEEPVPVDLKMDFIKVQPVFDELVQRALESNADLKIKMYQVEAARYGIDIYESKKKPHLELKGSYGIAGEVYRDEIAFEFDKAQLDQEKQWYLGVHGSMPIGPSTLEYEQIKHVYAPTLLSNTGSEDWKHHFAYNLFDRFNAVTDQKTAEYALLQAESDYDSAKNEITLRLRDDYYSLKKYLIQIDSSIAKLRYQEKQNTILEYLLSVQEAMPANYVENLIGRAQDKYAFIQAVADYNLALSSISVLIGDPDYFENQTMLENFKQGKNDGIAKVPASEA